MKKMIAVLAAVSAVAAAAPAFAQPHGGPGPRSGGYERDHRGGWSNGQSERRQIEALNERIDRARARRTISQREARSLKAEVVQLRMNLRNFMRDGRLSRAEEARIDQGIRRVESRLRMERRDHDRRPY